MQTCQECEAEVPDEAAVCGQCGAELTAGPPGPEAVTGADYDQDAEREWFKRRYGIDIGDRTVDEYLAFIERQDYSLTAWFWAIVVAEIALVGLLGYAGIGPGGWELLPPFLALSVFLSAAIYADTALVGLFERWSKTRWVYIGFSVIPCGGQIAAFLYIVLRRLEREQAERERRRLNEAGFDVALGPS